MGSNSVNFVQSNNSSGDCDSGTKDRLMTANQFVHFLNREQRDPRLNEILYPYADQERVKDLIEQYELNRDLAAKGNNNSFFFLLFYFIFAFFLFICKFYFLLLFFSFHHHVYVWAFQHERG